MKTLLAKPKNTPPNRLQLIKQSVITNMWVNDELAQMRYNSTKVWHQVVGYHHEGETLYLNHSDLELDPENFPVVTKGLTAYLLQNLGKSEQLIFENYYTKRLNSYKHIAQSEVGASMRDIDVEFYTIHVTQEKDCAIFSELIHPYLNKDEIKLINQYVEAYFKYIEQVYSPNVNIKGNTAKNQNNNQLSVSDWSIIFYYLDKAGMKAGNKIDRMEKFMKDNNVVTPSGTLTTKKNFRKEYYEIANRINGKNRMNLLPPKRIENILPYLKNNEKAMQNAEINIDYLNEEIKEYNKYKC